MMQILHRQRIGRMERAIMIRVRKRPVQEKRDEVISHVKVLVGEGSYQAQKSWEEK